MTDLERLVMARAEELDRLRPQYEKALGELENSKLADLVYDVYRLLYAFNPADPPSKAVYILATALGKMQNFIEPLRTVKTFEQKNQTAQSLFDLHKSQSEVQEPRRV